MKLNDPVREIPGHTKITRVSKYTPIWEAVSKLPPGAWLPVEFDTMAEAARFASTAYLKRGSNYYIKKRGTIVYVREGNNESQPRSQHEVRHDNSRQRRSR